MELNSSTNAAAVNNSSRKIFTWVKWAVLVSLAGVVLVPVMVVVLFLLILLLPAIQGAREAARIQTAENRLQQIGLALTMYHDKYGEFPPAVVADADGQPLYSGRVLLLPFLEQDELFAQFNLDESWKSPTNLPLSQTRVEVFTDPKNWKPSSNQADFLFVTGKKTVFESGKRVRLADIIDGWSNTVLVVEVKGSGVNWAEPRDLDLSEPHSLPPGNHKNGNMALFPDGSVRFIPHDIAPAEIRKMATRNGKEPLGSY